MWNSIRKWALQKFLIDWLLKAVDRWLKKLPENDRKTIAGFSLALLGILVRELPAASGYLQPFIEALQQIPHDELIVGGVLWSTIGLIHKGIKWAIGKFDKAE